MAQVVFKKGTLANLGAVSTKDPNTLYFAEDQGVLFLGDVRFSDVIVPTSEPVLTTTLANRLYVFNNKIYFRGTKTVSGGSSQEAVICIDVGDLSSKIAALESVVGDSEDLGDADNIIEYVDNKVDEAKEELQESIDAKVASVSAADKSINVDTTTATAPKLKVNLHTPTTGEATNALELKDSGLYVATPAAADTYEIAKAEDAGTYAAVYRLMKKTNGTGTGTQVGVDINIPKDLFVKEGSVVTVTEANKGQDGNPSTAGTYIKLVLQDQATPLFIPVDSLIEYVTSGSGENDAIQVVVSTDHKVTASIKDGTVTLANLATAVQTEIGKAHEHENKALLDTYKQTEVDLADAVAKKHQHTNATELNKIQDGDVAKWNAAATSAGTAIQEVQVNSVEVEAEDGVVDISATTGDANGQIKIAGQAVPVKGLASAAYKTEEYFIGVASSTDAKTDNTILGAKTYADDAVRTALSWQTF